MCAAFGVIATPFHRGNRRPVNEISVAYLTTEFGVVAAEGGGSSDVYVRLAC